MTQDQLLASDPDRSVWVSASAGTGKTKVLTDRVLRLLLTGAEPGSILCVTFTKAAAAEMLDRIERQLGRWAVLDDESLRETLQKLTGGKVTETMFTRARQLFARVLDAPDHLRVQTIHSFCQSVIARFPLEAGISPHTTLLDDHDAAEMLAEARLALFEHSSKNPTGRIAMALRELAQSLAESTLQELLAKIIATRRKFTPVLGLPGGVEQFSVMLHKALKVETDATLPKLVKECFTYTTQEEANLRALGTAMLEAGGLNNMATGNAITEWLSKRDNSYVYAKSFLTQEGTVRKVLFTAAVTKKMPAASDIMQAEVARVERFMPACKTLRGIQSTENMMVLAAGLLKQYREEKQRRGVIDYDDLIMHTVQLLRRADAAAWVLFKLDGSINHLLVDEAQDTSPEQWQIVEALVSEFYAGLSARNLNRTLFVVGDEKQSIFSFQGADPSLFNAMRLMLARRAEEAEKLFSHVRLDLSFRSTEAVLSAVDKVFATPEARDGLVFSEIDLTHKAHRKTQAGRVEFWPLVESEKREKVTVWERLSDMAYVPTPEQRMAQQIAEEIAEWLKSERILPAQGRPVCPGDIMILVQRRGGFADAMLRALKRAAIPVAGADRLVITDHIAVMDCMALADFLLLPQDDLTLAALLKSPFIGLDEQALFTLAHNRGKQSLWRSLRMHEEYSEATQFLSDMLARADYMAPYELFSYALVTLGKRKNIAARLGKEADDPLAEFLTLALQYERSHPPSLQGFMHWLRSSETQIKRDMEKGRDEVRILTVHASKGLQAPIIFLPDTTRVPRHPDTLQWLEGEMMLPLWSEAKEFDPPSLTELKRAAQEESYREYRRLLYVAMTRAEDELYICGWKGEKGVQAGCWYELIRNAVETDEAWQAADSRRIFIKGDTAPNNATPTQDKRQEALPPEWLDEPAPPEPSPTRPLSPSRLQETPVSVQPQASSSARQRGILVHRLLQYLPDYPAAEHQDITQRFIERYGAELSIRERGEVTRQVQAVLNHPDCAEAFAAGSLAEAPIVGVISGKDGQPITIAGQIDRLAVTEESVFIVDFKTAKDIPASAEAVPVAYQRQMHAYRDLMQKIYPQKAIKCGIIYTAAPILITL